MDSLANAPACKKDLRAKLKAQRSALPVDERQRIDAAITQRLLELPAYAQAQVLLPYLSFGSEVSTYAIIQHAWDQGKTVALPYCVPGARAMRWYGVTSFADLIKSPLGVLEPDPATAPLLLDENSPALAGFLALVPGLTFDQQGYRLGYGGGFYDVFLGRFAGTSVGLCREQQLCSAIPCLSSHDLPVYLVVTEDRVLVSKGRG